MMRLESCVWQWDGCGRGESAGGERGMVRGREERGKMAKVYRGLRAYKKSVLPPVSERLSIRTMAQAKALGALLGCGCRVYK